MYLTLYESWCIILLHNGIAHSGMLFTLPVSLFANNTFWLCLVFFVIFGGLSNGLPRSNALKVVSYLFRCCYARICVVLSSVHSLWKIKG